jgi:undecaprenyl-diphosphatase
MILAMATLGAEAFDQLLKWIFHRQRPEAFFGHSPLSYSFPSGHSVESCCFYGVLAALVAGQSKRLWRQVGIWLVAALVTLAIGCSRIYLGVHYPTDVLGGYAAAIVWVSLIWLSWRRLSAGKVGTPVD